MMDDTGTLHPASALSVLRDAAMDTRSPAITKALAPKLSQYPLKARADLHHCICLVPATIAVLLQEQPQIIAPAVRALCNRDSDKSSLHLARLSRFDPKMTNPPVKMVHRRVTFSRWLYLMLEQQSFYPPKSWEAAVKGISTNEKNKIRGCKLTWGFELMYQQSKSRRDQQGPRDQKLWRAYLKRLESRDFFQGLTPGSKAYKARMEKAEQGFREGCGGGGRSSSSSKGGGESWGEEGLHEVMDRILESSPLAIEDEMLPDDEVTWMNVGPDELDTLLQRYGTNTMEGEGMAVGKDEREDDEDITRMVKGMREFMGAMAGIDGAEVPPSATTNEGMVQLDVERLMEVLRGGDDSSEDLGMDDFDEESEESVGEEEEEGEEKNKDTFGRAGGSRSLQDVVSSMDRLSLVKPEVDKDEANSTPHDDVIYVQEIASSDSDDEEDGEEAEGGEAFISSYMVSEQFLVKFR